MQVFVTFKCLTFSNNGRLINVRMTGKVHILFLFSMRMSKEKKSTDIKTGVGELFLMNQVRDRAWFVRLYGEIIPELKLKLGDYLSVQAHKPCSISLVP